MPKTRPTSPSPKSAQPPAPAESNDPLATFRARLESGRFNTVLGHALRRTIRDAATDPGLDAEVGALRLALARLLTEERDPSKLAAGVSRLTAVAVQAARLRQPTDDGLAEIREHFTRVFAEIDAETEAEEAASLLPLPTSAWYAPAPTFPATESPSPTAVGEGFGVRAGVGEGLE